MSDYTVRFAERNDIPAIMNFIDENWKKGHILATNKELFEWQYINNDRLNMVIGEDDQHILQAILGYVPYADGEDKDFCLALWKAKEGTAFLGVKLLRFLLQEEPHRKVFCNGINLRTTEMIYRRLGFSIGKLKQWYRLCDVSEYRIAVVNNKMIPNYRTDSTKNLVSYKDFSELEKNKTEKLFVTYTVPYKSEAYIFKRYFEHPIYEYEVYGVENELGKVEAAIVFRVQECNDSKALRIIDFFGDYSLIYHLTSQIDAIACEIGAEYIDMYAMGLEDKQMIASGWLVVGEDANIIPNYFSPYSQCNVEINACTTDESIILFKGDGDQDRPS